MRVRRPHRERSTKRLPEHPSMKIPTHDTCHAMPGDVMFMKINRAPNGEFRKPVWHFASISPEFHAPPKQYGASMAPRSFHLAKKPDSGFGGGRGAVLVF